MNYREGHQPSTLVYYQSFKIDSIAMDGNQCIVPGLNPMNDQEHGGMTAQVCRLTLMKACFQWKQGLPIPVLNQKKHFVNSDPTCLYCFVFVFVVVRS